MASFSLCATSTANTGEILCDVSRGVLKKILIDNGPIVKADYADVTTFSAKLVANSKLSKASASKVFPIPEAQDIADASEANKEGSLGLGFKAVLIEGKPAYTVKAFAGSTLVKALRKFNNQTVRIREYDANGNIWGTTRGTDYTGFLAKLFFSGGKIATGAAVEEGLVIFTVSILSTSEYFDNAFFMPFAGNIDDVAGLNDVKAIFVSKASNVYKVRYEVPTARIGLGIDMGVQYAVLLANIANFAAFTGAGFATSLPITSLTYEAASGSFVFTFDSVTFNALPVGAQIKVVPDTPAELNAIDITNVEIDTIILTK